MLMDKERRQTAIMDLIRRSSITSQEELRRKLSSSGFRVTQATLSRDLRELGVGKQADELGVYKYTIPETPREVLNLDHRVSGNILVLRTEVGLAPRVAYRVDALGFREVLGTVAGEDTLLVVLAEGINRDRVVQRVLEGLNR